MDTAIVNALSYLQTEKKRKKRHPSDWQQGRSWPPAEEHSKELAYRSPSILHGAWAEKEKVLKWSTNLQKWCHKTWDVSSPLIPIDGYDFTTGMDFHLVLFIQRTNEIVANNVESLWVFPLYSRLLFVFAKTLLPGQQTGSHSRYCTWQKGKITWKPKISKGVNM